MMSSVATVKVIKTKVTFRYHTKGVSNQVSWNSDREIKNYSCSSSCTKIRKNEKWEKNFWVTKRDNNGITYWGKRDYKQRQLQEFQIETKRLQIKARGISNRWRTQGTLGKGRGRNLNKNMQVGSTSGYDENDLGLTMANISLLSLPITEYKVFTFETDFALLLPTLTGKVTDLSKVSIV